MGTKDFLIDIYSAYPLKGRKTEETFYNYIKTVLERFLVGLKDIEENELIQIVNDGFRIGHFRASYTKQRFINLMNKVCDDFLKMLQLCYKGDFYNAHNLLEKVLNKQRYGLYLEEHYRNYFSFKDPNQEYFRMRDEDEYEEDGTPKIVDNCWHVPYDKRHVAYTGRFSLLGYPCLYLASSKETCNAELGELKKGRVRWVSSFIYKGHSFVYDFRLPVVDDIKCASYYDQFTMFLQYPLLAMCYCVKQVNGFNEEYFIPQLLFHHIFVANNNGLQFDGLAYTSTRGVNGFNIAFPAKYDGLISPSSGYSEYLTHILEATKPEIYAVGV